MGENDGTVDKIYLVKPNETNVAPFNMKYKEKHIEDLYKMFPNGIYYHFYLTKINLILFNIRIKGY